jgi:hypothetical protein
VNDGFGRQNVAIKPAVANTATPNAMPPPARPVISNPAALSSDTQPGPKTASADSLSLRRSCLSVSV